MSEKDRILIIEDDSDIREILTLQLKLKNYNVDSTENFKEAKNLMSQYSYSLFLVDRMLPDSTGIEICKYIRTDSKLSSSPIILVTAMGEPDNIVEGLDAGADDYIVKPFDIDILHARVRAQLRKNAKQSNKNTFEYQSLKIDFEKHEVYVESQLIQLTHTEFEILVKITSQPGVVFSRKKLIQEILGEEVHVTNRTIDTHIAGLRKKLNTASNYIETIRGVGYRFKNL